jgi:hypothetical protein
MASGVLNENLVKSRHMTGAIVAREGGVLVGDDGALANRFPVVR